MKQHININTKATKQIWQGSKIQQVEDSSVTSQQKISIYIKNKYSQINVIQQI